MKIIYPSYYQDFRCIAGACRHSCCIGWEIDIDEDTLRAYKDPSLPLFERLQQHIDYTGTPHFRLTDEERCPFLNRQGLCDIILHRGEKSLCQICADHPRFRNDFSDRTEIGLGLCCEAAAELILFGEKKVTWVVEEDGEEGLPLTEAEKDFLLLRERIYAVLQEKKDPLSARLQSVLTMCGAVLPVKTYAQWAEIYRNLERMDPAWDAVLSVLDGDTAIPAADEVLSRTSHLTNLAVYFVFRHLADALWDDKLAERAAFCVLSVLILHRIWYHGNRNDPQTFIEIVRLYSSEVEYCEENRDTLLTLCAAP